MDGGFPPLSDRARIGPNAILQLVAVLDDQLGQAARNRVMHAAGQVVPPSDAGMWPEAACRAVHLTVYRDLPDRAEVLMTLAGTATADYILAHRIPGPAKALIRAVPSPLGARLLTAAITRHAWTFAGSGGFAVTAHRPLTVEIADNPLTPGAGRPCHWHAAVFTRMYRALVWPAARVEACEDRRISRFVIRPRQAPLIVPLWGVFATASEDRPQGRTSGPDLQHPPISRALRQSNACLSSNCNV